MEIKYYLEETDYVNFNVFHMQQSKTATKLIMLQRFLTPAIYLVAAYFFAKIIDGSYILSFIVFGLVALFWVIYYPKYYLKQVRRHVQKMLKEGNNENLLGEHVMTLTDEKVIDRSRGGVTEVEWSAFESLKEDDEYFFLYNSAVSALILPKRDMENVEEVKSFLRTKISN